MLYKNMRSDWTWVQKSLGKGFHPVLKINNPNWNWCLLFTVLCKLTIFSNFDGASLFLIPSHGGHFSLIASIRYMRCSLMLRSCHCCYVKTLMIILAKVSTIQVDVMYASKENDAGDHNLFWLPSLYVSHNPRQSLTLSSSRHYIVKYVLGIEVKNATKYDQHLTLHSNSFPNYFSHTSCILFYRTMAVLNNRLWYIL